MKILLSLILLLSLSACSHKQAYNENANREIASSQVTVDTIKGEVAQIKKIFPRLGNPRYYVFSHFANRVNGLGKTSDDKVDLVAAAKVMDEAGIYLNMTKTVDPDSKEVAEALGKLSQDVAQIYNEVYPKLFPEDKENAESSERLGLIKSLAQRVSSNYKNFVKAGADQSAVKSALKTILAVKYTDRNAIHADYKALQVNPNYKKAKKLLSNLSLPQSGDIDGSDDAFEKVMSTQLSMEMINWLVKRELREE